MHNGNHIRPTAVNLAVDESLQIHGRPSRLGRSPVEIERKHVLGGDQCGCHASGEQKAIRPNWMTLADMAEPVHHALIEQDMVRVHQFADRRGNCLGCNIGHGGRPFLSLRSLLREIVWTHTMLRKNAINPLGLRMSSTAARAASVRQRSPVVHHPHALTDRSLSFLVRQAHRAFVARLADRLVPHGVSAAEWAVLRRLWQQEGLTQVDLADCMRVRKASLTAVLTSLERKGFIRRTRRGEDLRKYHLFLTEGGRGLKEKLLPIGGAINREAVAGIDPDEAALVTLLLEKVIANLEGR